MSTRGGGKSERKMVSMEGVRKQGTLSSVFNLGNLKENEREKGDGGLNSEHSTREKQGKKRAVAEEKNNQYYLRRN